MSIEAQVADKHPIAEILLWAGRLTSQGLEEASEHLGRYGGSIENSLYCLGTVGEADLLMAKEQYLRREGIRLSDLVVDPSVLAMVPSELAIRKRILPVSFDPESGILTIACKDPTDNRLSIELQDAIGDNTLELLVAVEPVLEGAIFRHYRTAGPVAPRNEETDDSHVSVENCLCIVDRSDFRAEFWESLSRKGTTVFYIAGSREEGMKIAEDVELSGLIIQDESVSAYAELIAFVKSKHSGCAVRFFSSYRDLVINECEQTGVDLLSRTFELFSGGSTLAEHRVSQHARKVGSLSGQLCRELGLPAADSALIVGAAYLHDFARSDFDIKDAPGWERNLISISAGKLETMSYDARVVSILRKAYLPLESLSSGRAYESIGPQVLAICDYFYSRWPDESALNREQFESVRLQITAQAGSLCSDTIARTLIQMLRARYFSLRTVSAGWRVCVATDDATDRLLVADCLENLGYEVRKPESLEDLGKTIYRHHPQALVLIASGDGDEVEGFLERAASYGARYDRLPTFLMVEGDVSGAKERFLKYGVEDVISSEGELDVFLIKLERLRFRLETESDRQLRALHDLGTHGTLKDMGVIDLLQAMGGSGKTARISITGNGRQLTIYLDRGRILHAECEGYSGADAVYEGIAWTQGIWSVDPVPVEELPEANVQQSNESILLEGCQRLDEMNQAARQASEESISSAFRLSD